MPNLTPEQIDLIHATFDDFEAEAMIENRYSDSPLFARQYASMAHLVRDVTDSGSYYFSAKTMQAFKSRVLTGFYGGRFGIVSDRYHDGSRIYRVAYAYGADEMQLAIQRSTAYSTAARARAAAEALAKAFPIEEA